MVDPKSASRLAHAGRIKGSWREGRQATVRLVPIEFRKALCLFVIVARQRAADLGKLGTAGSPAVSVTIIPAASIVAAGAVT